MKAFPTTNWQSTAPLGTGYDEGMNLRDYFAAKAMQGYMSRKLIDGFDEDVVAEMSYKVADSMMNARENKDAN